ncbi:MAG: DNA repair protein RadA [Bacteroidetes bacterium GWF2_42_66]|nr:MAG: DNA repair protein RadA [Bacteroidetes bacterium GWA2_42_15]OFX98414.1 MAG: DNA repair protein RadA [Bacteroidetes bacterium GWE2_42_39]OFY42799.1 MAG: DNA repair protein RadA [Bacteroidetes bacterium GWF2_42_66]HBL74421.1 DNA repair protein RadA [Prolixibacteraceae bacterium]HCR90956.1 DNA repair protein RadA [Prolixibacteraceae bacterium]
MAKAKTIFTCQQCGAQSPKWIGKCPSCGSWNSYVEEVLVKEIKNTMPSRVSSGSQARKLSEVTAESAKRIDTKNAELNRVLGGGLVDGSLVLIGGEPGIGKSTLALQIALDMKDRKVLYVSGEESIHQIKLRAQRLQKENEHCYFLSETSLENILIQAAALEPNLMVIDSIQTVSTEYIESSPGSVSQIRECANGILKYAKENSVPVILIGHITKDGSLAGPKVLEHIVDTVLQFEGENQYMYRILRSMKNRFGSTSELGIFEMQSNGLREVNNPSELLINQDHDGLSGTAIAAAIEGVRPLLIEIQSLTSSAVYGTPQRSSTGFDLRRMNMLLAVLEKRAGFKLAVKDVFLNIAGGIKVDDPAIDLAVITAILSSNFDLPVEKLFCFAGEVGLSGEIRSVNRLEQRIGEAEKLGFKKIFIPKNIKNVNLKNYSIEIEQVSRVDEFFRKIFNKKS